MDKWPLYFSASGLVRFLTGSVVDCNSTDLHVDQTVFNNFS